MYIELIRFKRGVFVKREPLFFTKQAYEAFEKIINKFQNTEEEVLICMCKDDHTLVRSWSSVCPIVSGKDLIKEARGTSKKKK